MRDSFDLTLICKSCCVTWARLSAATSVLGLLVLVVALSQVPQVVQAQTVPAYCAPVGAADCAAPVTTPYIFVPVSCGALGYFQTSKEASDAEFAWDWAASGYCNVTTTRLGWVGGPIAAASGACAAGPPFNPTVSAGIETSNYEVYNYTYGIKSGTACTNPASVNEATARRDRTLVCAQGFQWSGEYCWDYGWLDGGKTLGKTCPSCGNPINPGSGNKFQEERDYASTGDYPLSFTRYYNSLARKVGGLSNTLHSSWEYEYRFGTGARSVVGMRSPEDFQNRVTRNDEIGLQWRHNYQRSLRLAVAAAISSVYAYRADGRVLIFTAYNGAFYAQKDVADRLEPFVDGLGAAYRYTDGETLEVERYNAEGLLLNITSRAGITHTMAYDVCTHLLSVTDSYGNKLLFNGGVPVTDQSLCASQDNRISTITDPSGGVYAYGYDAASGALTSVTYPDGRVRQYGYSAGDKLLSSITDENGIAYASFSYDSLGRGTNTQHAGGVESNTISYSSTYSFLTGPATITDSLGAVRTWNFSLVNRVPKLTSSVQPASTGVGSATESRTYDVNGNLTSVTEFNGSLRCYAYDMERNLEVVRVEGFASGSACPGNLSTYVPAPGTRQRKVATTWHASFRLPTQIVEAGRTTAFTHDAKGNVLTRTITDTGASPVTSRVWTYTYNSFGQVLTENGPRTDASDVTTYTYYSCATGYQCGRLQTMTNALGQITTYNSYNAFGQPTQITDPNSAVTTLSYDQRQRPTARCVGGALPTCAGGELTSMEYWPTGLLKKTTLPDGSFVAYSYDMAHRLISVADSQGSRVDYTLDLMGNRTAENVYDPVSTLKRTHTRAFNALNRLYQDINAASTGSATTTYAYDDNGNQIAVNAPGSRNSTNIYDELNRLKQVADPGAGNTYFAYDAMDNLTAVTDPRGLVTSYGYTGYGDVKNQSSPDTGSTTNTFDSGGNLKTSTDARNAISTYTYDALNRVTSVTYKIGTTTDQTITYAYDVGTNGKGRLTGASDANHSMAWAYNALGRVASKSQTQGTVTSTVSYGYTNGLLTTLTLPSGNVVTYGYNTNGQVTSVALGATTILSNATYEPFGPIKGWTWGNGTTQSRSFDQDGRLTVISTSVSNGVNLVLGYDAASRITSMSDSGTSPNSWTYSYDLLDRLSSATGPTQTQGWTYDANGNRLTESGTQATTFTVSGTSNRVSSTNGFITRTYGYDNAGNASTYEDVTLTYNNRGRLKSTKKGTTTRSYVYNALGQMIKASGGTGGTVLYAHDEAGHLIGEYTSTGALTQETIYLGDIPVATIRSGTPVQIFYVHADHLGTPVRVTRPSDNKRRWQWATDPFGTLAANGNPEALGAFAYNLRFPGQLFDGQAGLHQNMYRDYSPAIGRYVESDPIGLTGGINPYAYVGGDPIRFTDTFGLSRTDRWFGFNNRDFQWWFHNCYKQKGDPDVSSREKMAEAYAEYLAAGSPPRGKCSNNKPQSCPVPEPVQAPAPENPADANTVKTVSALAVLYWILSEGSRLFPPRNLIPVP